MDQEGAAHPTESPRRVTGVLVLLVVVVLVGWFARTPGTTPEDEADPDELIGEETTAPPAPTPEGIDEPVEGLFGLGLDEVLPVIQGTWREIVPPGGGTANPNAPPVMLWDGTEVVVIDPGGAHAYDPITDAWRRLPDLPTTRWDSGGVAGVVPGDVVVIVDTGRVVTGPDEVRRSAAWTLRDGGWQELETIPDAVQLLGAVDGQILSARRPPGRPPATGTELWLSDPSAGEPVKLPSPPSPIVADEAIDTPDGFVVLGSQLLGGAGTEDDPFRSALVGLHWADNAWTVLDLPANDLTGGTWVPHPTGRVLDSDPAGGLVLFGGRPGGPGVSGIVYDLGSGDWQSVPVPVTEQMAAALGTPDLAVAWDGADTVWIYGGHPSAIHLAMDLSDGDLRVARPAGGRMQAGLHWDGEGLLLLSGLGMSGPVGTIQRWTPSPSDLTD